MTSAHSTRNTSIRTRKIRGDDSLVSSTSMAVRGEGFWGIGLTSSVTKRGRVANMARIRGEKRPDCPLFDQTKGELEVETGHYLPAYFSKFDVCWRDIGFCMTLTYLAALVLIAVSLSILMAGAWAVQ